MPEKVVFYASRNRYGWIPSLMLVGTAIPIAHAMGSADRGLRYVGIVALPLLALTAVVWIVRLIHRPALTVTDKGLMWRLPLASRSFDWSRCTGLNLEIVASRTMIELHFNDGKRFVVPHWFDGYDEVFATLTARYALRKSTP